MKLLKLALLLWSMNGLSWAEFSLEQEDGQLTVKYDGALVTQYRTDQHVPSLYPLIGPSGENLVRNFPFKTTVEGEARDHPHHVGMWFTHGAVNGLDFWTTGKDPQARIKHIDFETMETGLTQIAGEKVPSAHFTVGLAWKNGDKTLLTESRTYHFTQRKKTLSIDVHSVISPTNDEVTFGDTKEGSFALRLTPTLRLKGEKAKGSAINSEGVKDNAVWGKRAAWVAYYGPDIKDHDVVVAILDHPSNLRHPTWWHARDYGLFAANPFGQHDFEKEIKDKNAGNLLLKPDQNLTQTYRVLLHWGKLESIDLPAEFEAFSAKK